MGDDNSLRMIILSEVPIIAAQAAKKKYRVPISLWLVENNHFFIDINFFALVLCVVTHAFYFGLPEGMYTPIEYARLSLKIGPYIVLK